MNKSFRFSAAILGLLALAACSPAFGNYFAPTAALVNGDKIVESRISIELRRALANPEFAKLFKGTKGIDTRRDAQREILTRLIREQVVLSEARKAGVRVSSAEVDQKVDELRASFKGESTFQAELRRQNFTIGQVRDFLLRQTLFEKMQAEVAEQITVTDEQLRSFFEQSKAEFEEQIRAAHILICGELDAQSRTCKPTPQDEELARSLVERARGGEDFAALARQHSKDTISKERGGDLGWFARGALVPAFEEAAYALQPGQISDPVSTQFGVHVIRLIAKGRTFDDAKEDIEERIVAPKRQEVFQAWLADALKNARISVNPQYGRYDRTSHSVVPVGETQPGGE